MASYHVLRSSDDGTSIRVAFHISTPAGNNVAGISWSTCLVNDPDWDRISDVPGILKTEQNAMTGGTLVEIIAEVATHPDRTLVQKRDQVDAAYIRLSSDIPILIQRRYQFTGFSRSL